MTTIFPSMQTMAFQSLLPSYVTWSILRMVEIPDTIRTSLHSTNHLLRNQTDKDR